MSAFLSPVQIVSSNISSLSFDVPFDTDNLSPHIFLSISTNLGEVQTGQGMRICPCTMAVEAEWHVDQEGPIQAKAACTIGITVGINDVIAAEAPEGVDFERMLRLNAVSLAYSKIRCALEAASAETTAGKLTLPTINPVAYFEEITGQAEGRPE